MKVMGDKIQNKKQDSMPSSAYETCARNICLCARGAGTGASEFITNIGSTVVPRVVKKQSFAVFIHFFNKCSYYGYYLQS